MFSLGTDSVLHADDCWVRFPDLLPCITTIIGPQVSICEECAKMAILQANEIKADKMRRDSAGDDIELE